jgi:hypothetical protein
MLMDGLNFVWWVPKIVPNENSICKPRGLHFSNQQIDRSSSQHGIFFLKIQIYIETSNNIRLSVNVEDFHFLNSMVLIHHSFILKNHVTI